MDVGLVALIVVALFTASIAFWPAWFRWENRRKRAKDPSYRAPTVLGVFDEIYRPDAHAASQIAEAESVIPAPAPKAGGRKR